jgi:hypothetical protein
MGVPVGEGSARRRRTIRRRSTPGRFAPAFARGCGRPPTPGRRARLSSVAKACEVLLGRPLPSSERERRVSRLAPLTGHFVGRFLRDAFCQGRRRGRSARGVSRSGFVLQGRVFPSGRSRHWRLAAGVGPAGSCCRRLVDVCVELWAIGISVWVGAAQLADSEAEPVGQVGLMITGPPDSLVAGNGRLPAAAAERTISRTPRRVVGEIEAVVAGAGGLGGGGPAAPARASWRRWLAAELVLGRVKVAAGAALSEPALVAGFRHEAGEGAPRVGAGSVEGGVGFGLPQRMGWLRAGRSCRAET